MIYNYNGYLNFELPANWLVEDDNDVLVLYNPNGDGAMTVSFYNVVETQRALYEQISIMAKRFIDQYKIDVHAPLLLHISKDGILTLNGTGTMPDGWYIKIWIIAKHPKIIFATYQSENVSKEVESYDFIINSMSFIG